MDNEKNILKPIIWCSVHEEYAAICAGCLNEVLREDPKDTEIRELKLKIQQLELDLKHQYRLNALKETENA